MRLSVPSWLVPGPWLANLVAARGLGWASGVELLLFSFEGEDRKLFIEELPAIREAAKGFEVSVHLPDPLLPAHAEILELTRDFAKAYVVHPRKGGSILEWAALVEKWRERHGDVFMLEYTDGADFEVADAVCPGLSVCADTGKLLAEGKDPGTWLSAMGSRLREVHLHAFRDGKEHRALAGDEAWLRDVLPLLSTFDGMVELEVFSLGGVETSHRALMAACAATGVRP